MRISDWSSDVCSSDLTDANDHNQRNVFKDAVIQSRKAHFTGGDDDKNLIHLDTPLPFDIRDVLAHANFRNTEMVDSGEVYAASNKEKAGQPRLTQGSHYGRLTNFVHSLATKINDRHLTLFLGEKTKKSKEPRVG